jgi:hypothetical protein
LDSYVVLLFFALSYYAGGWEHNIYKRKKRELEVLKKKLEVKAKVSLPLTDLFP